MQNVTVKDVAKAAGVSIATVSRVINNNYFVSKDLEQKVMNAIKQLNYYPNSVARSLKNKSTLTIGFLVSDISNNFFTIMSRAIEDVIQQHSYSLLVCSNDNKQEKEYAYLKLLLEKKVDGIIINTTGKNDEFISDISKKIPIVLCGRKITDPNFIGDFVDSDNISGSYDLTSHLINLGHRKIGIINGLTSVSSGSERFEGFQKAMKMIGMDIDSDYKYKYDGSFDIEGGYKGAAKLMESDDHPTAIVVTNNEMSTGALKYFRTHNIRIPEDVSIASFGNIVNEDLLFVQPSCVRMNTWIMGKKQAELIVERIETKNQLPNREIRYSTQLIVGNGVKQI